VRSFNDIAKFTQCLDPATLTADADCTAVDMKNFGVCRFLVAVGESGDTLSGSVKIELEVEESDDNSTFSDVADADLDSYVAGTNDGCFAVIDAAAEDDTLYEVEYRGSKRYARVVVNLVGSHSSGTPVAVIAAQGGPTVAPVS
jgi:hypothetical protein